MNIKLKSNILLFFSIVIAYLSFLSINIFKVYSGFCIFINSILLFACLIWSVKKISKYEIEIIIIIITIVYSIFTLFFNNSSFGWIIILMYFMITAFCMKEIKLTINQYKIIFYLNLFLFLIFLIKSNGAYFDYLSNIGSTFNSNTTGAFLMITSIYILLFANVLNYRITWKRFFVLFLLTLYGIYNCRSRGALIGYGAFCVLYFIGKNLRFFTKRKILISSFLLIIIVGLIVPKIYLHFYSEGININFGFTDKQSYTGREIIWQNFYDSMELKNWILGYGSNATFYTDHELNMHNIYLSLIVNSGLIGLFLFFWYFKKLIFSRKINNFEFINKYVIYYFFSLLILNYFEVTLMWSPLIILLLLPLNLINYKGGGNYEGKNTNMVSL